MTTAPVSAESQLTDLTADQLRARTARAQLYLIEMEPLQAPQPSREALRDHLAYLVKLESEGRLYGCGPVDGTQVGLGHDLAIVAAASRDEAEKIAVLEPLHQAGLRRNRVRRHTMNEGVACYVGRALAQRAETMGESFDPSLGLTELDYDALGQRAAGIQLYLIVLEPTDKARPPEDTQTGYDHFVWLRQNEMNAVLMSCGPVEASRQIVPGAWGGGLGVVATQRAEAERIAAAEPSGRAGYRGFSVHSWLLNYGLAAPIARALVTLNSLPR